MNKSVGGRFLLSILVSSMAASSGSALGVMTLLPNIVLGQDPPACNGTNLDNHAVQEIIGAWKSARFGTASHEEVVLIVRERNGCLGARRSRLKPGYKTARFIGDPYIVAIFHTHPNSSPREPTNKDRMVARRLGVPIYTLTSRGVWGFDPTSGKTVCLLDGLDWLDPENWKGVRIPTARTKNRPR